MLHLNTWHLFPTAGSEIRLGFPGIRLFRSLIRSDSYAEVFPYDSRA